MAKNSSAGHFHPQLFFWSCVEQPGECVEFFLQMKAKVFAVGQELADESGGVFVDAALPGRRKLAHLAPAFFWKASPLTHPLAVSHWSDSGSRGGAAESWRDKCIPEEAQRVITWEETAMHSLIQNDDGLGTAPRPSR